MIHRWLLQGKDMKISHPSERRVGVFWLVFHTKYNFRLSIMIAFL